MSLNRLQRVSEKLLDIRKEINENRKKLKLKPLSINMFTKLLAKIVVNSPRIKEDIIKYDE